MSKVALIGAPLCDGERERGVEKAPRAIRKAGIIDHLRELSELKDFGDVPLETPIPDEVRGKLRNTKHVVNGCRKIMQSVAQATRDGYIPMVIGGDCSLFPGSVAGVATVYDEVGVLYFDGHPDVHTPETTTSGYYSGMALAAAVGKGQEELVRIGERFPLLRGKDVVLLGVRSSNFDPPEAGNLERSEINIITIETLRHDGLRSSTMKSVKDLPTSLYLHFDLDVIDPTEMPALAGMRAGVHSPGGLSLEEAGTMCTLLGSLPLVGMDITLYDPSLDPEGLCAKKIVDLVSRLAKPKISQSGPLRE